MPPRLAILLICLGSGQCVPPQPQRAPRQVVLIVIESLRSDALGCYGSKLATPAIDGLAARATRFDAAMSTSGDSVAALASLLTGVVPAVHRAHSDGRHSTPVALPADARALERLTRAGVQTVAVTSGAHMRPELMLTQGFARHDHSPAPRSAQATADAAIAQLGRLRHAPFLLLVHFDATHLPYVDPAERTPFQTEDEPLSATIVTAADCRALTAEAPGTRPTPVELAHVRDVYDAEVQAVDAAVGRVLDALAHHGLLDQAGVLLTADHGEEFWEHGGFGHGASVHAELLHVPLLVKPPHDRVPPGDAALRSINAAPVRAVDVLPTAFDWFELAGPAHFSGSSLTPLLAPGATLGTRHAWAEVEHDGLLTRCVRDRRYTYMTTTGAGSPPHERLYDHQIDALEVNDLMNERPLAVTRMRALMNEMQQGLAEYERRTAEYERRLAVDEVPAALEPVHECGAGARAQ